ncbi:transposase [Heliophilum fasciatum]|nr:transposase [Heliophilum fasciatum]
MSASPEPSIAELQKRCEQLAQQNTELTAKLKWYEEQFRLQQHRRFGASSERSEPEQDQLQLFNEAETEALAVLAEPTLETITYQRRKATGQREVRFDHLPVETIEYRLTEEAQICSCCGGALHEMSKEERNELQIVPAQVKVVKHVRYVYACRRCEREAIQTPIVTAPMPKPVLKGSLVSPSMMAYVMNQKYMDSIPLYRQEQQFLRLGVELSRQNLANWMLYGAHRWLSLLYGRMKQILVAQPILHADETTVQVLHEPNRAAETTSYLWLYRTGREGPPIILYDYQQTRAGTHPRQFLAGFKGYLHVDGYAGYHGIPDVTLLCCWSHSRRKFDEAIKALPEGKRSTTGVVHEGLEFCNRLFAIERDLHDVTPEERYTARLARSKPVLDAFLAWLQTQSAQVLPKSALGQAIAYCLNQWTKLEGFLLDGRLEIDNNRSERSIKPFVIGRNYVLT